MPYFLSDKNLDINQEVEVSGEEARHVLLAHRARKNEKIKLQGPDGKRFESEIVEIGRNKLKLKPSKALVVPEEPKVRITLFQAVVSEKALDFIFQKGTELGVSKIVLYNCANVATKLSLDIFKKKQERWNKILTEAAKQSERVKAPTLEFILNVNEVIKKTEEYQKVFFTDLSGSKFSPLTSNLSPLAVVVGPEGGFTPEEVSKFKSLPNVTTMSLGPILLRADTAALASLAILQNLN